MSEEPKNAKPASETKAPLVPPETEATLGAKIETLRTELKALESEVKILEGRIKNRSVEKAKTYQAQNEELEKKVKQLSLALWVTLLDEQKPRKVEELELLSEVLRKSALRYFKEAKIEPELWKSIES